MTTTKEIYIKVALWCDKCDKEIFVKSRLEDDTENDKYMASSIRFSAKHIKDHDKRCHNNESDYQKKN